MSSWMTTFLWWTPLGDPKGWSLFSRKNGNLRRPVEGWSLENIPVEMVQEIAKYLPPVELAILALTSKTMLYRLGPRVLQIKNTRTHRALLEAFSERGLYLPEVLCSSCEIFHSTFPLDDHRNISLRKCQLRTSNSLWGHGESPYLPVNISFNAVAGVMRCHQHNKSALFPLSTLASSDEINKDTFKIHTYNDLAIVDGNLILKTEKLVLPLPNPNNKLEAVSQMCKFLSDNTWTMDKCCRHTAWSSTYPNLLESIPSKSYEVLEDLLCNKHRSMHNCLWTHALPCPKQSGSHARSQDWNFIVHSCRDCFTDFSLAIAELPNEKGRVCVLTAWKDLGAGKSPKGIEWRSHLFPNISVTAHGNDVRPTYASPINRVSPSVYRKFEGVDESFGVYQYKPLIRQKRLMRLIDGKA